MNRQTDLQKAKPFNKGMAMTKTVTKVRLLNPELPGLKAYQQDDLDDGPIEVFGTSYWTNIDGTGCPCYILMNKDGVLVERAMSRFVVLETE